MTETRHVYDQDGNIAVSITLPTETSEEEWERVLTSYIVTALVESPEQE